LRARASASTCAARPAPRTSTSRRRSFRAPRAQAERSDEKQEGSSPTSVPEGENCDYGFTAGTTGLYTDRDGPSTPRNVVKLAVANFQKELRALREWQDSREELEQTQDSGFSEGPSAVDDLAGSLEDEELCINFQDELKKLTIDADAVYARELDRHKDGDYMKKKSWVIKVPYLVLCWLLDRVYSKERPIQRFWFLETVARMPYFSYISMLHLYETLGWWRRGAAVKKVHFAEEWNEFHHLLIMESLGGDDQWIDRFAGYHSAVLYYWVLNLLWLASPVLAYQFSELLETHAVDTYGQFVDENEDLLKTLPAPAIARQYYQNEDLYMFDEFQTSRAGKGRRRPEINTLYDTFSNIRDDELEHVKTMVACQNTQVAVRSPHQR